MESCMLNAVPFCLCCFETDDIISFVEMIVGGIECFVICLTFCYQRKSYKEVQFKDTYYRKQNYHRKLTDSLKVNAELLSQDLICSHVTYIARQCFLFSEKECHKIYCVLTHESYLGALKDDDFKAVEYWENENDSIKKEQSVHNCLLKYTISYYGITEDIYHKAVSDPDKTKFAFGIFLKKWLICYEHYQRSLLQTLVYIQSETPKRLHKEKYVSDIVFQMSKDELWFIKQYSVIDETFSQYYNNLGVSDIVNKQLTKDFNIL